MNINYKNNEISLKVNFNLTHLCNITVVTGGSEGIGLAYAKELARRKLNIILISRNQNKLDKAAAEIGNWSFFVCNSLCELNSTTVVFTVVTGSSEGIGRAYARELASRGLNLVLISKPENRLYRAAKQIGINMCLLLL